MWMLPPEWLCRKHLLGEHVEMHMFAGALKKGNSIEGFVRKGLLEPGSLLRRHDQLAEEMERRGYTHNSPIPAEAVQAAVAALPVYLREGVVDTAVSRRDLSERCPDCCRNMPTA